MLHIKKFLQVSLSMFLIILIGLVLPVQAAVSVPNVPKVTFTFDDGRASTYTRAATILNSYNLSGTAYITTDCVGMTKVPNTCHAANDVSYMTWAQIKALRDTYKWEIGSHSKSHPYMASTNADDGQPKMLTPQQIVNELAASKAALAAQGINATSYASPYGDYNPYVLQEVAKVYSSHRGFADQNDNTWPYNDYLLNNMQVQTPVTVDAVKAKIDSAIAKKTWLVLTFHDIVLKPSKDVNKYQWGSAQLDTVAAYVKAKRDAGLLQTVNASGGLATGTVNMLPGADFTGGIATGWRTDTPIVFQANNKVNGSFPEQTNSIAITATNLTKNAHFFSPRMSVSSSNAYLLKSYLNVTAISAGEVGYYIDEYDANGEWISGQYKARETGVFVQNINISYIPTSVAVKTASLQVYVDQGSTVKGFMDSLRWYQVASSAQPTNLLASGTFDNPWNNGWTTDNSSVVTLDTTGRGSTANPTNSIKASSTTQSAHLFSPKIGVDATKSYYLESYVNIVSTGELGVYIDEYDASGVWISGQYKHTVTTVGPQTFGIQYKPSSLQVKTSQIQYIYTAQTSLYTIYLDDIKLFQQ
ncbi:MAG: polysaccharide deacetylase family protein [Candidatus Saccharimonadales bacterium]